VVVVYQEEELEEPVKMTEYERIKTLEEFLKEHEEDLRKNAIKCYEKRKVSYFVQMYTGVCVDDSKKEREKYYNRLIDHYILNREAGLDNRKSIVDAMVCVGKDLLTYKYKKTIGGL